MDNSKENMHTDFRVQKVNAIACGQALILSERWWINVFPPAGRLETNRRDLPGVW